jgi:hypothetical protein
VAELNLMLIMTNPPQLDAYFKEMGQPAETLELDDNCVG